MIQWLQKLPPPLKVLAVAVAAIVMLALAAGVGAMAALVRLEKMTDRASKLAPPQKYEGQHEVFSSRSHQGVVGVNLTTLI